MIENLVSIITPSYNQGGFIEETIQSVLSQEYPHIGYVVMDGGSTDETLHILKQYTGRVEWVSQKDKGQSDAINRGIARSHGEIVTWLCSDDSYLPSAVSRAVKEFRIYPDADIVYGDVFYTDLQNKPHMRFRAWQFDLEKAVTTSRNPIAHAASFIRRGAWEKAGGLRASLHHVMDWDL